MEPIWSEVDAYFGDLLVSSDSALEAALSTNAAAGLPAIDVSPLQGQFLEILVRLFAPKQILEIGTLGGYSTIWLARALNDNGLLITLEADAKHADVAQQNIARAGLADRVEVRVGRALQTLPQIEREGVGPFDLIFIDADKAALPRYLEWALRLSRPGTLIVADNVVRNGGVVQSDSHHPNIQGVRRFAELVAAEPRLTASVLQTVGSKGYDGMLLAIVGSAVTP